MFKFLANTLSEANGSASSMRMFVLLILACILIPDMVIAIKTATPMKFDADQIAVIGMALGAKIIQKTNEQKPA